jgi:tetratricopeptide (TPR) repeat protein
MKWRSFFISLVLALVAVSGAARAEDKAAARAAYSEGTRYYDLGQYKEALEAFKRAYWNYEDPAFLFNLGQCHRQLGHDAEALGAYRSYLRKLPDAANRQGVTRMIDALEAKIEKKHQEDEAAAAAARARADSIATTPTVPLVVSAAPPPPPGKPLYRRWWVWTIAGVVVAGAATGIAVGVTQSRTTEPTLNAVAIP